MPFSCSLFAISPQPLGYSSCLPCPSPTWWELLCWRFPLYFYVTVYLVLIENSKSFSGCPAMSIFCFNIIDIWIWVFQHRPVQGSWDLYIKSVDHFDLNALPTVLAALNVVSDFVTVVLPMLLILKLQMPKKQIIQLVFKFLSGYLWLSSHRGLRETMFS